MGKTNYQVIEDNGGGLTLVILDEENKVTYLHTGYEYQSVGQLPEDVKALLNGDNPAEDWEGNAEKPQEYYDNMTSYEYGWEIVADQDGIYPDRMGMAACLAFGVKAE